MSQILNNSRHLYINVVSAIKDGERRGGGGLRPLWETFTRDLKASEFPWRV